MFALSDGERHAIQRYAFVAPHGHVLEFDEGSQPSILIGSDRAALAYFDALFSFSTAGTSARTAQDVPAEEIHWS